MTDNSWLAWQKVVLTKLEDLEKHQYGLRDQMQALNEVLVETVGRSGENGRIGMLKERMDALEVKEHTSTNKRRGALLAGGAVGGGTLSVLVELIRGIL